LPAFALKVRRFEQVRYGGGQCLALTNAQRSEWLRNLHNGIWYNGYLHHFLRCSGSEVSIDSIVVGVFRMPYQQY
jgi:hypothetical protein